MEDYEKVVPAAPSAIEAPAQDPKRLHSRWKVGGVPLAFIFVLALLALLAWGLKKAQAGPLSSGLAPDFSLTGFDGRKVTLSELRGQVVIINFWASWCLPCREEAAYLEETWRKYKNQGVVFIGVDYVDTEKEALAYIQEFDITYINGPDLRTEISDAYNIKGVPETFYVSKSGELRGMHIGPLKAPELDQKIEELLAEPLDAFMAPQHIIIRYPRANDTRPTPPQRQEVPQLSPNPSV